jgi:chromosome segregation ATPase
VNSCSRRVCAVTYGILYNGLHHVQERSHYVEEVEHFEAALAEAAARERQFEEEQEILSDKLIALANQAAEWPARQEQLETEIAVGQGQIRALTSQVADYEERMRQFEAQDQVLTALNNELADFKGLVRRLNGELQASHTQHDETKQLLGTSQATCAHLEELCDCLSGELQEHKQALSDLRDTVLERDTSLALVTRQEESLQTLSKSLEAERASLREKLDTTAIALTDTQIELAEKTTTLKMQLQIKDDLLDEHDALRRQLETVTDGAQRLAQQTECYKEKLEEVTKELSFTRNGVDRKEQTFVSQRNTIRDLRQANDELEASLQETRERCVALQVKLEHSQGLSSELEESRKQLMSGAQEREQLKHANFALSALRRELDQAQRELATRTDSERQYQLSVTEMQSALMERESTHRELSLRAQQAESYQLKAEAATAQLHTTATELATARAELRSATETLQTTKASFDAVTAQYATLREESGLARHQSEALRGELAQRAAAVDTLTRVKGELEVRVTHLEAENRELQAKAAASESSKSEFYSRALESATKEKERHETKAEHLQSLLDVATREGSTHKRALDETHAKLTVADGQVESLRGQLHALQQDHAAVKVELTMSLRERKHIEEQNHALAAHKTEAETYKAQCAELQRQLQQQTTDRYVAEQKQINAHTQEVFALRKELDEARSQVVDTKKYKDQFEVQDRERSSVLRDLAELKVENERLQSRIKTTQMDMELSQRQYQFSNLMMAGGVGRTNPYESPTRSDRLSSAMENISSLLKEKEAAVVQGVTAQQTLEQTAAQLVEARHQNTTLTESNAKLEGKLEKLRERLETTMAQRSADEQKALSLRDEISALNTQVQIKAHDLQIKTQECDRLTVAKESLERRLADEVRTLQEKWLKAQGDLQKETNMSQTLQFQVEEARRDKAAMEERHRAELLFAQKNLETAKSETVAAQDQLLQVKGQGVNDKERAAVLSSKVSELTARLDQAEAAAERSKDEVNKGNTTNAALSTKLATAAQQCRDWEHQLEQQQAKYDALQARFDQQTSKCEGLQNKLDALAREVSQALAVVERNAGKRTMLTSRSDSSAVSIDYLLEHLAVEIEKYHTVYTEVTERRSENAALESNLTALEKQNAAQRSQIQDLSSELSALTKQLQESRGQAEALQSAHRESDNTLASLRSVNAEMEYMCETMSTELKQAMRRVEELDASSAAQREEWIRKMDAVRAEAEARVQREVVPLQRQVAALTEKLESTTASQQDLSSEQLRHKADVMRLTQDLDTVTESVRSLYQQVVAAGPAGSPSKSPVPDLYKTATPSALLNSLQSTFNEWGRQLSDLRANAGAQTEAVQLKNRLIDDLQVRLQEQARETTEYFKGVASELDKLSRAVASKTPPASPRSNPASPTVKADRKTSLTSPLTSISGDTASVSTSQMYHKVLRAIVAVQNQVDRSLQVQAYECDRLRMRLAQKEKDYESVASIQSSAHQLQLAQQEQQLQQANELIALKQQQQAEHEQHVRQLQHFKDSLQAEHAEQMQLLKETHRTQLSQQAQQLKHAQHALSRSLRERTALQEALDTLKAEYAARERDVQQLGDQAVASQEYFQTTQGRYITQIAELERRVEQLTTQCKDLQKQVTTTSTVSEFNTSATAAHYAVTSSPTAAAGRSSELFHFDNAVWTKEQLQQKLQELIEYRSTTEQKILDFDNLIMNTFYHRSADGSPETGGAHTSGGGRQTAAAAARHKLKSPEQLRFELEHDNDEERGSDVDESKGERREFAPTSPVWRMHSETQGTLRQRLHSSGSASLSPPGAQLAHTASGGLLSGMLQDFHHVLKEHRRLKRLCSSQQVCIMALR